MDDENGVVVSHGDLPKEVVSELLHELQRQALAYVFRQMAELRTEIIECAYGAHRLLVRPVFGIVVGDIMVRAPLAGVLRRFSLMQESLIAHIRHYSAVIDEDAGAAPTAGAAAASSGAPAPPTAAASTQRTTPAAPRPAPAAAAGAAPAASGAAHPTARADERETKRSRALRDRQFPSEATKRTEQRDRQFIDSGEARERGIDENAYRASPLHLPKVLTLDLHQHLATDAMHTWDGVIRQLYQLAVQVFSETRFDEALLVFHRWGARWPARRRRAPRACLRRRPR